MESLKSTWRAVRFLSVSHGQKREGPASSVLEGVEAIVFSLALLLISGVG